MSAGGSIAQRLDGQSILITGVTGFVGEALLHRMLTELPGTRLAVLVRPKGATAGATGSAELLAKPTFADGRRGAPAASRRCWPPGSASSRATCADVPELPTDLDVVVHCAGDVSFDPPIDEAFATNVVGTRELLEPRCARPARPADPLRARLDRLRRRPPPRQRPRGLGRPRRSTGGRAGAGASSSARSIEDGSRRADVLRAERTKAEKEHGRAGPLTAAAAAEARAARSGSRRSWSTPARERARSLGWTDVYTFTKALGERVVEEHARDAPGRQHRAAEHHRVRARAAAPGLDRGLQDGRAAHPGLRPRRAAGVPRPPPTRSSTSSRSTTSSTRSSPCWRHPPEAGEPAYFHVSSGDRATR